MAVKVQGQPNLVMPKPTYSPRALMSPPPPHPNIFTSAESLPSDSVTLAVPQSESSVASGLPEPGAYPMAKWTILNYSAADNNLYAYIYDDIASMEEVGSTGSVQLVTQLDHQGGGAYRFRIEKDRPEAGHKADQIDSPVRQSLGPINMSDPENLADFIEWGIKNYPAERYMLVIADHGKGWEGLVQDESHKGWMSVPQLKQALSQAQERTGRKLDVLGFDACQMASLEVASQIRDYASYMVASQAPEGREGWPYQHILAQAPLRELHQAHLFKSDVESRMAVELVVNSAAAHQGVLPTMSALDLSKVGELEASVKELSEALERSGISGAELREARHQTQAISFVYDLGDFLDNLAQLERGQSDTALREAIAKCKSDLQRVVIAEQHSEEFPRASGLTIELKRRQRDYLALDFPKNTGWDRTLSIFTQA